MVAETEKLVGQAPVSVTVARTLAGCPGVNTSGLPLLRACPAPSVTVAVRLPQAVPTVTVTGTGLEDAELVADPKPAVTAVTATAARARDLGGQRITDLR
jgi:hypothetical protein